MNVYYADSIRAVWQSNSSNLYLLLATCSIQRGFQDWGWLVPDPRKSRSLDSQRFLRHFDPKKQLRCVCPGERPNFRWFKRTTACAAEVELVWSCRFNGSSRGPVCTAADWDPAVMPARR